jgi:hypothetical protein
MTLASASSAAGDGASAADGAPASPRLAAAAAAAFGLSARSFARSSSTSRCVNLPILSTSPSSFWKNRSSAASAPLAARTIDRLVVRGEKATAPPLCSASRVASLMRSLSPR